MKLHVSLARSLHFLRAFSMTSKHHGDMINSALKPDVVLSEDNRKACIEKFKSYQTPKIRREGIPEAAVLIPLCLHKGEVGILYTLRSMRLSTNRGQVSFPGGKRDKDDIDLIETALRETYEELNIPREKIDVWCAGNLIWKININVMPVLAYIGEVVPENLKINHDEVEEAFVISLQKLCNPELCHYTHFLNFLNLALPSYLGGKYRVWGFTGIVTHVLLSCLVPNVYKLHLKFDKNIFDKDILKRKHDTKIQSNL